MTPEEMYAYIMAEKQGQPYPQGEAVLAQNAQYAYLYAKHILKGPFPAGEPVIAQEPFYAYQYAVRVICKPFPAGEPAIALFEELAYWYALFVLGGRFPAGEPAIVENAKYTYFYLRDVVRWESVENLLTPQEPWNDPRYQAFLTSLMEGRNDHSTYTYETD